MLQQVVYPLSFSPVRDPVWLELRCNGYEIEAPTTGSFTLAMIQQPNEDDTFRLNIDGEEVEFTFVEDEVDDSGTQVLLGADNAATQANLLTALQSNHTINQAYAVTENSGLLVLTRRTTGLTDVAFSNTVPVTISFNEVSPGSDGVYAENYTANHQVWVEKVWNSGVYEPLPSHFGYPDDEDLTRWDIRGQLKPYVGYQWPAYAQASALIQREWQRRFYVERYESYGDPPVPKLVQRGNICRAIYAGSRNLEHNVFSEMITLMRAGNVLNPFMTYRGRGGKHEVTETQQHYLGWLRRPVKVNNQQLYVRFTVYYTDNTTATAQMHADVNGSGWQQDDVILYPTGYRINGLDLLQPTKVPWKYTMQVLDHTNAAVSEVHTWHLADADSNEQYVEYVSSWGVVESLRTVGGWSVGIEGDLEPVKRMLTVVDGARPSSEQSRAVHLLKGAQRNWKVSTGFMDKEELLAVVDILLSPEQRRMDLERGEREPLVLVAAEQVMERRGSEDEHLYALNLEFLLGDAEMAWSNRAALPGVPDPEVDPGGGGGSDS